LALGGKQHVNASLIQFHCINGFVWEFTLTTETVQNVSYTHQQCYNSSKTSGTGICPDRFNRRQRSQLRKHHLQQHLHIPTISITFILTASKIRQQIQQPYCQQLK